VSNHIGKYYLARNEADSALMYLENARKYSEQLNNHYGLSSVFHEMGNFYENLKHYDQALHYYSLSDSIANSLNFKPLNINPKLALAEVHIILGDYQAALYY
ncbi:hypothetical protein RZS08_62845, partial [Arthrospira platensis SPKY1]|nr:hypothetical protein [Arthrospira platensis SPKY1]